MIGIDNGRGCAASVGWTPDREWTVPAKLTGSGMIDGDVDGMLGNPLSETVLILFASVVGLSFCLMPLGLTVSLVSGVVMQPLLSLLRPQ